MASLPSSAPAVRVPCTHSWIGNREVPGRAGTIASVNPSTGGTFAEASLLDEEQAREGIAVARAAFPAWAALSFRERGAHLLRLREEVLAAADEIAALISREQGKPASEAHAVEVFPALEALKHMALHAEDLLAEDQVEAQLLLFAHKDCRLIYEPIGVVLAITPWNYPFGISLVSVASALAAGNTVVLKPAPATTQVGLLIGEICRRAGLPDGVVGVVSVADGIAPLLVSDRRIGKVIFTGSVPTGRRVMQTAAENLTPVVLELGGKDPAIVCADADLDHAAQGIVWGAFLNAGQTCASVERVYVEASVAEAFTAKVVEHTKKLRLGDPSSGAVDVGPMTMDRQRKLVIEHVDDAVARGATALTGGAAPAGPGWFYPPTVLTGVDHSMRVMREETFGPVLPIMSVTSIDEAVRLANDSDYGLTASAWTRDTGTARRLQRSLQAGVVTINDCVSSFGEPTAPWGGVKHSGIGRTHGTHGLREMVQVKYVTHESGSAPTLWWFPYNDDFAKLMSTANRALHGRSVFTRMAAQIGLLRYPRFWRRGRILSVLANADKLF